MFDAWWEAHRFELIVAGIMFVVVSAIMAVKILLEMRKDDNSGSGHG